jgi:hypothetical protein
VISYCFCCTYWQQRCIEHGCYCLLLVFTTSVVLACEDKLIYRDFFSVFNLDSF